MWTREDTTDEIPAWTIGLNAVEARTNGVDIPSGFGFGIPYETNVETARDYQIFGGSDSGTSI